MFREKKLMFKHVKGTGGLTERFLLKAVKIQCWREGSSSEINPFLPEIKHKRLKITMAIAVPGTERVKCQRGWGD